jgi:hypothetical protein
LAGFQRVLGEDHLNTLTSLINLAAIRSDLGDLQGARELHEQAVAGYQRVLGEDEPETLASMLALAKIRQALGDL